MRCVVFVLVIFLIMFFIISFIYNRKAKKKYNDVLKIIKDKKSMTINDIASASKDIENVDDNKLMEELYNKYITFQNKFNDLDASFGDILTIALNSFYSSLIEDYKAKKCKDVTDNIDLLGYSIIEYDVKKLVFRVNISCISYKIINDKIVSGSNTQRKEQILLITYENNDTWQISNIKKAYEKSVSSKN